MTKFLIIGLDGCTWDLIKPWADDGELPTFKKLMTSGVWGELESTFPPITCPAWPSMLTGKKPDKLGLYCFTRRDSKGYNPKISREKLLTGSIWEILNSFSKRCYIINVPMSEFFEKDEIDGVFVGDPILNTGKIPTIEELGYRVHIPPLEKGKEKIHLKGVIEHSKMEFLVVKELLNEDWDLLFYVNCWTDQISHSYWKYIDEKHPEYHYNEEIIPLIKKFYKEIDQFLEVVLNKISTLFIVSDHGFGSLYYEINLNQWLALEGFMTKKRKQFDFKLRLVKEKIMEWFKKVGSKPLLNPLAKKMKVLLIPEYDKRVFENTPIIDFIDWSKTRAYSIYYGGININLKGREPAGIVRPEEYESLRQEIMERALQIKDPDGRKVVEKVYRVEELYKNPSPNSFPDIILRFNDFEYFNKTARSLLLNDILFIKTLHSGSHKMNGIFLAYGPDIKKGVRIEGAKIYDITPTILHIFGLPLVKEIDGKVLKEIFMEDSEYAMRPLIFQKDDEKDKIKEKIRLLKKLGKI